jgi:hypothetical protein
VTIEPNTWIIRAEGLMTTGVDQELVILNITRNSYAGLDDIGRRIWDLLATPRRVDDLCRQLNQEYEASREQVRADVLSFLAEMEREGLVHVANERPR